MRPSPKRLLLFAIALGLLIGLVQIGLISIAFQKLGLSEDSAYMLLLGTLAGSMFNLPLLTLKADPDAPPPPPLPPELAPYFRLPPDTGTVMISVNVGGALIPTVFSLFLLGRTGVNPLDALIAVAVVALVAKRVSRPISGIGIGMPMLVAPILAALLATVLDPAQRAPLAYIGGTLGVLIGTDILRLNDIRRLGARAAAIGGAGALDGVFITGLIAVLLA